MAAAADYAEREWAKQQTAKLGGPPLGRRDPGFREPDYGGVPTDYGVHTDAGGSHQSPPRAAFTTPKPAEATEEGTQKVRYYVPAQVHHLPLSPPDVWLAHSPSSVSGTAGVCTLSAVADPPVTHAAAAVPDSAAGGGAQGR